MTARGWSGERGGDRPLSTDCAFHSVRTVIPCSRPGARPFLSWCQVGLELMLKTGWETSSFCRPTPMLAPVDYMADMAKNNESEEKHPQEKEGEGNGFPGSEPEPHFLYCSPLWLQLTWGFIFRQIWAFICYSFGVGDPCLPGAMSRLLRQLVVVGALRRPLVGDIGSVWGKEADVETSFERGHVMGGGSSTAQHLFERDTPWSGIWGLFFGNSTYSLGHVLWKIFLSGKSLFLGGFDFQ